jgi:hypothetical protein
MLGESNFNKISIGDLVSWTDLGRSRRKRRGLVLQKWVSTDLMSSDERKIAMLKVVDSFDNKIVNIYAINAKIESKSTT